MATPSRAGPVAPAGAAPGRLGHQRLLGYLQLEQHGRHAVDGQQLGDHRGQALVEQVAGGEVHRDLQRPAGVRPDPDLGQRAVQDLSLIHISEPTRLLSISYAVFCLKKKNNKKNHTNKEAKIEKHKKKTKTKKQTKP